MAISEYRYRINGALNTSDSVLTNMERLANSATSWISFDMFTGQWDVVINKAEATAATFDDSNIIGSIQLNVVPLKDMYNIVEVQFPHTDLNGQKDYIRIGLPLVDRLPYEIDNVLTINYDLVNDPVQALYLGLQELKQSRLDKSITFRTDYSKINIPAGSVIAVTNTTFGWTSKLFRIITVKEIADNDALHTEITALEYSDNVYSTDDLERYTRTNASGIIPIGAIGKPVQPQVTKFEFVSRPGILIEADVPVGLVNGMEFWLTRDTSTGSDENRSYSLIGTVYATGGNNFITGDTVELNYDTLDTGNLLVKVRGVNGDVTGPYSDPSGLINYNATQVTDAIGDADVLDQNNGAISNLLGANALLWLLNQLMNGSTQSAANVAISLGDLFGITGNTANTIANTSAGISSVAGQAKKLMVSASTGKVTVANLAQTGGSFASLYSTTFVPDLSGQYKVDYIIDQNTSGAEGADNDEIAVDAEIFQGNTSVSYTSSGGPGAWYWNDFAMTDLVNLTAGVTYTLVFEYVQDTPSLPSATASFDVSWNIYSTSLG